MGKRIEDAVKVQLSENLTLYSHGYQVLISSFS